MSRARHKHKAEGGKVEPALKDEKSYTAGPPNVEKEAEEKKHGGRAKHKHGGRAHEVEGHKMKHRMDRPGRKRGGRTGSDMAPLTTASKVRNADGHDAEEGNADEGP